MAKYFLTVKETILSVYEVEADSRESAIKEYENGGNYSLYESETTEDNVIEDREVEKKFNKYGAYYEYQD